MRYALALSLLAAGCSSSPTPTAPAPAPTTATITGHLHATNGGQAVPGASVDFGAQAAVTDAAGAFRVTVPPLGPLRAQIAAAGIVPRTVYLAVAPSRDVTIEAIALGGSFNLGFYRQFVRNTFDAPAAPQALRRWTRNPHVYLQTTTLADAKTVDMVERTIRDAVPQWTGGAFSVASTERGPGTREGQPDWLTVKWSTEALGLCGRAEIGQEGGFVELFPLTPGCDCAGYSTRPTIVRHEVGHAMGFWHTDETADVMNTVGTDCDRPLSDRERYHAAIAYRRPVGNMDPDTDPSNVITMTPMRVP